MFVYLYSLYLYSPWNVILIIYILFSQVLVILYLMAQTTSKWVAAPSCSYLDWWSVSQVTDGSSSHLLQQAQVIICDCVALHTSQTKHQKCTTMNE